ncbi:MAG: hypothetical protein M0R32_11160 [Candidatus Cloacimonetes bacterium]|jgi:hypothetical protein|nr:hypothetical protein [Candidatus Cloacimonadota bacterium]
MSEDLPQIREIGRSEFQQLVDSIHSVMRTLPKLDYDALHDELRESEYLQIIIPEDPSLNQLSSAAVKVQAAKDRVSQIMLDAERNSKILKHYSKAIYSAWLRLSGDGSQDRRESDATTRTWDFAGEAAEAEALFSACKSVLDNLKDKWDTISRNVSIVELRIKLGEWGGNNPTDRVGGGSSFSEESNDVGFPPLSEESPSSYPKEIPGADEEIWGSSE